jgi:chromosome segregation ATPase
MSSSRSGLGLLEYACVAGSIVGSAIALATKEAIFGLAPVSLSLVLNLINRNRLEELCQQSTGVTAEVQQLRDEITSVSAANEKVQDVQNLASRQELNSVNSMIEQLNQQQEGLRLSLVPMQSRLDDLIQAYDNRPELKEIENLATVITALRNSIDQLPSSGQLPPTTGELQPGEETSQLSQNPSKVERLEKAINLLVYQFHNRPELEAISSLSVVTEALKQSIEQLPQQKQSPELDTVQQEVETSKAELSQHSKKVQDLQKEIDLLRHQTQYQLLEIQQQVSQSN